MFHSFYYHQYDNLEIIKLSGIFHIKLYQQHIKLSKNKSVLTPLLFNLKCSVLLKSENKPICHTRNSN